MTILVADDYAPVRESLVGLVESIGEEVLQAEDGDEALQIIELGGVDVLLLDLYMPRCDGMTVLERLDPARPPAVIVVSAFEYISRERLQARFGDRIAAILNKPLDPKDLMREVTTALSARRSRER